MSNHRRQRLDAIATPLPRASAAAGREPLSARLKQATREAHRLAESSGVIRQMIRGRVDRATYACYLRNLHPVYAALEDSLATLRPAAGYAAITDPALARRAALESDLVQLAGGDWQRRIALLPAAESYARRIACATPPRLVAHAYVRYLGDLNGGTILERLLRNAPGLSDAELGFYEFPAIDDLAACRLRFKACLDDLGSALDCDSIVDEARQAFELATELSVAIEEQVSKGVAGDRQSA